MIRLSVSRAVGVAHDGDGEVDIQGSTGSHETKNYRSGLHLTGSADTILEILLFGWCTVHSVPDIGEYEALFMRGLVDAGAILAVGFVATQQSLWSYFRFRHLFSVVSRDL
jgi:hypothetical protein